MQIKINLQEAKAKLLELTRSNKAISFKFKNSKGEEQCVEVEPSAIEDIANNVEDLEQFRCIALNNPAKHKESDDSMLVRNNDEVLSKKLFNIFKKHHQKQKSIENERGFLSTNLAFCFFEFQNNDITDYAPCLLFPARFDITKKFCLLQKKSCN
jgi:hypothetical protein